MEQIILSDKKLKTVSYSFNTFKNDQYSAMYEPRPSGARTLVLARKVAETPVSGKTLVSGVPTIFVQPHATVLIFVNFLLSSNSDFETLPN